MKNVFEPPLTAAGQPCQKCAKWNRPCPQHKDAAVAHSAERDGDGVDEFLIKNGASKDPLLVAAFPSSIEREEPGRLAAFETALRERHARDHPGEGLLRQQSPDRSFYEYRRG